MKDYVCISKRGGKEMFVQLSHPAEHGQADFGEALAVIGGDLRPKLPPLGREFLDLIAFETKVTQMS